MQLFKNGMIDKWLGLALLAFLLGCGDDKKSTSTDSGIDTNDRDTERETESETLDTSTESDEPDDAGDTESEQEPEPDPGEMGAVCNGDTPCTAPLACLDGRCQPEDCTTGTLGCACDTGRACVEDSTGASLKCTGGMCVYADCSAAGETGCPCINGESCTEQKDVCDDGICFSGECAAGEQGCMCLAGGCKSGLYCIDNKVCVDSTGYEGGACLSNGLCYEGTRCDTNLDVCVYCDLGSQGCQCSSSGGCNSGLVCNAGLCVDEAVLPPSAPKCYTPCLSDLDNDDDTVVCDADGLLEGCINDLVCEDGSCVKDGEEKPSCESDMDCPFFQTCLAGGCYSNCETISDCSPGFGCYKKVCRVACSTETGTDTCSSGNTCETEDGTTGYCVQMQGGGGGEIVTPDSGFSLSRSLLSLSNVNVYGEVQLLSDSSRRETFTVRKLSHTIYYADGSFEKVDMPKDPVSGEVSACDASAGECPLYWLDIGIVGEHGSRATELEMETLPLCTEDDCPSFFVDNAGDMPGIRWEGKLEIVGESGRAVLPLTYVERPEGRWGGTMYYYGNFSDTGFEDWLERDDRTDVSGLDNALIRRWAAFRKGSLPGGWDEFQAVLTATQKESWSYASVVEACESVNGAGTSAACYPYSNTAGVRTYVSDAESSPIPTGLSEFPMGMNLLVSEDGTALEGRIETSVAMHYAANPSVALGFAASPADADSCDPEVVSDCVIPVTLMESETIVGGRYLVDVGDDCAAGYEKKQTPYLVPGFEENAAEDENTGSMYQYNCVGNQLPYDLTLNADDAARNISLAGGNPVPDGQPRVRSLTLLDGALVNQTYMFLLFKESFDSFVSDDGGEDGDKGVSAYGYMVLKKQAETLSTEDENDNGIVDAYEGSVLPESADAPISDRLGVQCDADFLDGAGVSLDDPNQMVNVLINGIDTTVTAAPLPLERVHYFCEDTGLFDSGPDPLAPISCPAGSRVDYFVVPESAEDVLTDDYIRGASCQATAVNQTNLTDYDGGDAEDDVYTGGTCQETLKRWRAGGNVESWSPFWKCEDEDLVLCDENRLDLLDGKVFYDPSDVAVGENVMLPIHAAIADAFRYKTRFKSRSGSQVGFAPEICIPDSDQIPYCYDPEAIEEIRHRVDCLVALYTDGDSYSLLNTGDGEEKDLLDAFLRESFSQEANADSFSARDGFERLYSELLIMQGDESLTAAFASRFDLAGTGGASFEGDLFEENGINLSGTAGFEMYRLYQAVQYYQLALDRLYTAGPDMSAALALNPSTDSPNNFISPETVVLYLDRMIRASTQKARSVSEIAKNYQGFNRADLARSVIERAYTSTYMESVILARLMSNIEKKSTTSYKAQIQKTIEDGQRRYKMALLDMKEVYNELTDDISYFGFAPDYVPFPALNTTSMTDINAFETLYETAQSKTSFARLREEQALASDRSYNTDAASFQSELVRIRNNYEAQLGEICGTFEIGDGQIYPAIQKYAPLDTYSTLLGDPCGLLRNGRIYSAMVDYENSLVNMDLVETRLNNIYESILIETDRVKEQCNIIEDRAEYIFNSTGERFDMVEKVTKERQKWEAIGRVINAGVEYAVGMFCIPDPPSPMDPAGGFAECASQAGDANLKFATAMAQNAAIIAQEQKALENDRELMEFDRKAAKFVTEFDCQSAQVESNARVATLLLSIRELRLEQLRAAHQSQLLMSEVDRLFREGKRLQGEQAETEELLINVEAARNDPNVRIYRNDAIINADIAFNDALQAAYRATKVFEYYTSQTYAPKEQLFLIRMVTAGDYNLENYLMQLQNEYYEFEEQFGNPDIRVTVLSLRDDIMQIPTLDDSGAAISQGERIDMMREKLGSVDLLDKNGYLSIPFSTALDELSPLTRNHKVAYVETDIVGADVGDTVGRIYLRQAGTGVIRNVSDEKDYYVFPERTAVINSFFNGNRLFTPEVYRNYRFRDRPMVNTLWEMMINRRDEAVNKDIDLQSLSDIRLYVFYTDFTAF